MFAKDFKLRSIGGCRIVKPEEALGVGLMPLTSANNNGLKRLMIHSTGKRVDLKAT